MRQHEATTFIHDICRLYINKNLFFHLPFSYCSSAKVECSYDVQGELYKHYFGYSYDTFYYIFIILIVIVFPIATDKAIKA